MVVSSVSVGAAYAVRGKAVKMPAIISTASKMLIGLFKNFVIKFIPFIKLLRQRRITHDDTSASRIESCGVALNV
jgi:hypothetical protein